MPKRKCEADPNALRQDEEIAAVSVAGDLTGTPAVRQAIKRHKTYETVPRHLMKELLGKLFVVTYTYREPEAFRVVGFTKTLKTAFIEPVPLKNTGDDAHGNGHRQLDEEWLANNPVQGPDGKLLRPSEHSVVPKVDHSNHVSFSLEKIYRAWQTDDVSRIYHYSKA